MTAEQINIAIAKACGWTDITLAPHDMGELPPRLAGFHKETGGGASSCQTTAMTSMQCTKRRKL